MPAIESLGKGFQQRYLEAYLNDGHVTVPDIFDLAECDAAVADAERWSADVVAGLDEASRGKYVEAGSSRPRWIDHPVRHRAIFEKMARAPRLTDLIEALIGPSVDVYFSQIFFKPPEGGSPKPAHQDNFYAGPNNPEGLVTAWIALDEASVANGCLYFVNGSHHGPVFPHVAPPDQPYHLQLRPDDEGRQTFTAAPVPKGGVSFHHGGTIHRSGANLSQHWRRALAITYVTRDTFFADPKLNYDRALRLQVT